MKTAISLPDELFERAERAAEREGRTRSGLYADALAAYLDRIERPTRVFGLWRGRVTIPADLDVVGSDPDVLDLFDDT